MMIYENKMLLVNKANIKDKFAELKKTGKQKLSGILNEWFDRITEFQANKYSNSDIVKTLNEAGVDVSETQFRDIMFRLRKKRSEQHSGKKEPKTKVTKKSEAHPFSAGKLQEKVMDIEEFEKKMTPATKRSKLEPFRLGIFELKNKGYANWQIGEWLAENGVKVSQESVRKFIQSRSFEVGIQEVRSSNGR